jgi:hypothetical protein
MIRIGVSSESCAAGAALDGRNEAEQPEVTMITQDESALNAHSTTLLSMRETRRRMTIPRALMGRATYVWSPVPQ